VVLKGLARDGGLFIPEAIPRADGWEQWKELSFQELAFKVLSLYISPAEIPHDDLKEIIAHSYETFRSPETTPLVHLKDNLWLLELFHGPTFAFKDVALQFLGNLFEYFLARKNEGKSGKGMFLRRVGELIDLVNELGGGGIEKLVSALNTGERQASLL
jgi:threonine synthase